METIDDIRLILAEVLQLGDRASEFDMNTPLLGSIPEFDSMAVVAVLTAIEDNFGIMVEDDEVGAEIFETLGALVDFVSLKLSA